MAYKSFWRKLPKTKEDWMNNFCLDMNKIHMEEYECWYFTYKHFCVEIPKEGDPEIPLEFIDTEETDTVQKYAYVIKGVPKFIHLEIVYWHRHPNHWE